MHDRASPGLCHFSLRTMKGMKKLLKLMIRIIFALSESAVLLFSVGCSTQIAEDSGYGYFHISAVKAAEMMETGDVMVLDVRQPDEYAQSHIPDAVNIPNETIQDGSAELPEEKGQILLVYCRTGARSKQAAGKLAELGYEKVYDFGGINDWPGETVMDNKGLKTIYLAGGCFWGRAEVYRSV